MSLLRLIAGRWGSGANEIDDARIDASTNSLQTIEYEHHKIHSGSHFNYCDYVLKQGSGVVIEFVMTTPGTAEWVHLVFNLFSSSGATVELYEGASGISGGTPITPRNNNRNSLNASSVTLVKDPTGITGDGVRTAGFVAGGTRNSGIVARDNEYVLKSGEIYLIRVTTLAVSNDVAWCVEWYEHTDKH